MPALIEALKDEDGRVRSNAARAQGYIGPEAKVAVPALIQALKDEDKYVRDDAAWALGKIGPAAVPALVKRLNDKNEDKDVCASVMEALEEIDIEARTVMPILIEALKDKDKRIRRSAAQALRKIGPEAKAAVPALIELLNFDDEARRWAANALKKINTPEGMKVLEEYKEESS